MEILLGPYEIQSFSKVPSDEKVHAQLSSSDWDVAVSLMVSFEQIGPLSSMVMIGGSFTFTVKLACPSQPPDAAFPTT